MAHGPPARGKSSTTNGHVNNSQDDDENNTPIPPDGGWGWMVAIASFLIHLITDGITYSFGIFFNELIIEFKESNAITASVASILVGMTLCAGPISSSFVNRYGCRAVTIAGAILSSFCFFISIFANNIIYLIITIGVGSGIGFGLIYLPAIVSVTTYFEKYRSLATGIAVCGSGLGTFVFAPLIEYLVQTYGWRGAMLILSAVILNCIIFGAMFRPLKSKRKNKINRRHIEDSTSATGTVNVTTLIEHSTCSELKPLKNNNRTNKERNINEIECSDVDEISENYNCNNGNSSQLSRSHSISHDLRDFILKNHNSGNKKKITLENGTKFTLSMKDQKSDIIRATVSQPQINNIDCGKTLKSSKFISDSGTMYRADILYQGSLLNIPEYKSRSDLFKISKDSNRYGSLGNKLHRDQDNGNLCGCVPCSKETRDTFSEMMNFSLFRDIIFIVFVISNFCTSIGFNVPYIYIKVQVEAIGLPEETGSYLLSIIGIANTIARIVLGYISDKPWVNRLLVYNICLTLCGIATALSVFCNDFTSFAIYASVFGFTIGAYVGLTSVILVDLLGLDKLTNAFGLLLLFQGIASLAGPPFAGWLYDITKKYEPGFLLAGGTIAISGLVLFAIPPMQRYRAKKEAASIAANHTIEQQSTLLSKVYVVQH